MTPAKGQIWRQRPIDGRRSKRTIRIEQTSATRVTATVIMTAQGNPGRGASTTITTKILERQYAFTGNVDKKLARPERPARRAGNSSKLSEKLFSLLQFDESTPEPYLRSSVNEDLRDVKMTERELIDRGIKAARALSAGEYDLEQLVREGVHFMAKRYIATDRVDRNDVSHGIRGSANHRLARAVELCRKEGKPLTPSRVGMRAVPPVGFDTAKRYLVRMGLLEDSKR